MNAESAELISGPARAPASQRDASVAVTALFETHHLELVRLARLMVGDLATAEDVVQDAFEQLHRRWHRLRDEASILAYARSSVLNGCRTVHRRGAVARRYSPVLAAGETQADATAAAAEHEAMMAAPARPAAPPARGARPALLRRPGRRRDLRHPRHQPERRPLHGYPRPGRAGPRHPGGLMTPTDVEDRLRRDLAREAARTQATMLRPLAQPGLAPRRGLAGRGLAGRGLAGWPARRWLAPAAAVVAVAGVLAGVTLAGSGLRPPAGRDIRRRRHGGRGDTPLLRVGEPAARMSVVVVHNARTGRVLSWTSLPAFGAGRRADPVGRRRRRRPHLRYRGHRAPADSTLAVRLFEVSLSRRGRVVSFASIADLTAPGSADTVTGIALSPGQPRARGDRGDPHHAGSTRGARSRWSRCGPAT